MLRGWIHGCFLLVLYVCLQALRDYFVYMAYFVGALTLYLPCLFVDAMSCALHDAESSDDLPLWGMH